MEHWGTGNTSINLYSNSGAAGLYFDRVGGSNNFSIAEGTDSQVHIQGGGTLGTSGLNLSFANDASLGTAVVSGVKWNVSVFTALDNG